LSRNACDFNRLTPKSVTPPRSPPEERAKRELKHFVHHVGIHILLLLVVERFGKRSDDFETVLLADSNRGGIRAHHEVELDCFESELSGLLDPKLHHAFA